MTANRQPPPGVVLGAILIVIGLFVLAVRYLGAFAGQEIWPLFIIAPGLALFVLGLILPNTGMIVGGSVVTMIGAILAWQNQTGLWATWAYAWTLVGPTASGFGTFLGGLRTGNRQLRDAGIWQIVIGLALFAAFYLFFEQFVGLSGGQVPLPEWAAPVVLVILGLLVLLRGFFGPPDPDQVT
jgi:hypothetical protein